MKNPSLSYEYEQLYMTILSMATSYESLKGRFLIALENRLSRVFTDGSNEDVPADITERIRCIDAKVTENGSYAESVNLMDLQDVEMIIQEVISLFGRVSEEHLKRAQRG